MIESEITPPQKQYKVLLIGETCTDIYEYGTCDRISPEAPVPVLQHTHQECIHGMANNVFLNLKAFGIDCDFITNDAKELVKTRFIDSKSNQQILRQDVGYFVESKEITLDKEYDAIVISDYNKGLISEENIRNICETFDGPIFVDSKRKDLTVFPNAILKINQYEWENANWSDTNELIVTHGKKGAIYKEKIFRAPPVDVWDVTGAGDVFLACLCYYYLNTKDFYRTIPACVELATQSVKRMGSYILKEEDIGQVRC